jgi:hypothetical protein
MFLIIMHSSRSIGESDRRVAPSRGRKRKAEADGLGTKLAKRLAAETVCFIPSPNY